MYDVPVTVCGQHPVGSLAPLLVNVDRPDVFVACLQHVPEANVPRTVQPVMSWETAILNCLGPDEFACVTREHAFGLQTLVYVHLRHVGHVRRIRHTSVRCGSGALALGADMTNTTVGAESGARYGGLGVRFQLYQSTLCFVNVHLSPQPGDVQLRNSDYTHVVRLIQFDLREPEEIDAEVRRQQRHQRRSQDAAVDQEDNEDDDDDDPSDDDEGDFDDTSSQTSTSSSQPGHGADGKPCTARAARFGCFFFFFFCSSESIHLAKR